MLSVHIAEIFIPWFQSITSFIGTLSAVHAQDVFVSWV
jgi:hypothetical protein